MKVSFLTPHDEIISMDYSEVDSFCQERCLQKENKEKFNAFSRKYHYFHPYFDFVMKEYQYIFKNPLFLEQKSLVLKNNVYYLVEDKGETYHKLMEKSPLPDWEYAFLVPCSDKNLNIKMATIFNFSDCIIDPNKVSMMENLNSISKDGSHTITANTVLHQLLMFHPSLSKKLENIPKKHIHYALNYLVSNFGFLECDSKSKNILGNRFQLNNMLQNYVTDMEKQLNVNFISLQQKDDDILDYTSYMHFRR